MASTTINSEVESLLGAVDLLERDADALHARLYDPRAPLLDIFAYREAMEYLDALWARLDATSAALRQQASPRTRC